ncbi:TPA: hypothetical protein I8385_004586 [Citrobacter freundii]|uniref:hypothetical protein n=1 Tax=Citrobacter TaxID=544 RepID=UPI000B5A783B|nr:MULTISPECIES: hypothetical protein [Citrobacter]POV59414.1 hypothetical protein C3404_21655 [Citrobacter freundii complex sp. CFNIH11]ASJ99748.1 hypothetical protein CFA70_05790 [Citrobacter freundii]EJD6092063.1 hypothetical protein [Citrobacter freundii]EKS9222195.1 hypothetical protein [Citrobacter freundii]EKU1546299.1 hypothetical protein [Citrobacter freundii]
MKNMDKQLFAAFILLGVSPFCSAKLDCEAIAGIAAGEANYLYESAKVKTDSRLHFYSAPATECQLPAFMVNGDTVEVLRSSQRYKSTGMLSKDEPYRYVRYRDAKGTFATGWVSADGLTLLSSPLVASASCQSWANKEMSRRGYLPYSFANHYQVMGDARAWFYAMPTEQCRSQSVFLVPGDIISTQEQSKDDFIEAVYYTADRHIVRGWLKKSQLQALNSGDRYRDDINPLSTDKATRVATLGLRHDYQCIFYESWNAKKAIEIIVREDHQTALCRGGADPQTSPPVAYISIDKTSGEISWPDVAEGFAEE